MSKLKSESRNQIKMGVLAFKSCLKYFNRQQQDNEFHFLLPNKTNRFLPGMEPEIYYAVGTRFSGTLLRAAATTLPPLLQTYTCMVRACLHFAFLARVDIVRACLHFAFLARADMVRAALCLSRTS